MLMTDSNTVKEAEEMQSQWVPSFLQGPSLGSGACLNSMAQLLELSKKLAYRGKGLIATGIHRPGVER